MGGTHRRGRRAAVELTSIAVALSAGGACLVSAPLWAAPIAAIAGWGVTRALLGLTLRPVAGKASAAEASWDQSLAELRASRGRIVEIGQRILDPEVQMRVRQVVAALDKVIAHIIEDPDDLITSQRFLAVYVERTKVILARYAQYERLDTPQAEEVRTKVREHLLPALVMLCEQQLQRITYDDIRSFDTEVDVLTKSIELEGL